MAHLPPAKRKKGSRHQRVSVFFSLSSLAKMLGHGLMKEFHSLLSVYSPGRAYHRVHTNRLISQEQSHTAKTQSGASRSEHCFQFDRSGIHKGMENEFSKAFRCFDPFLSWSTI